MKPKKLYKEWKGGEIWEKGALFCVKKLRKRMIRRRTCRFQKHKKAEYQDLD